MSPVAKGRPLPTQLRDRLAEQVARDGERVVRERIGLSRNSFDRAQGGLPIHEGTILMVERGIGGGG